MHSSIISKGNVVFWNIYKRFWKGTPSKISILSQISNSVKLHSSGCSLKIKNLHWIAYQMLNYYLILDLILDSCVLADQILNFYSILERILNLCFLINQIHNFNLKLDQIYEKFPFPCNGHICMYNLLYCSSFILLQL